jgi:hypothetical protein
MSNVTIAITFQKESHVDLANCKIRSTYKTSRTADAPYTIQLTKVTGNPTTVKIPAFYGTQSIELVQINTLENKIKINILGSTNIKVGKHPAFQSHSIQSQFVPFIVSRIQFMWILNQFGHLGYLANQQMWKKATNDAKLGSTVPAPWWTKADDKALANGNI